MDLAHAPVFGFLAMTIVTEVRSGNLMLKVRTLLSVWLLIVLFGGAAEIGQGFTGRQPSWQDLLADSLGAAAFLIWLSIPKNGSRPIRIGLFVAGVVLMVIPSIPPGLVFWDSAVQHHDYPVLASFEHPTELSRWEFNEALAERSRDHATDGFWSLQLDLNPGRYPGATLNWPVHDWSGYRTLEFDAFLEPGPALDLIVKIQDDWKAGGYLDRFHQIVRLAPGQNHVKIHLFDVEHAPPKRLLDLRKIQRLQLFCFDLTRPATLYLDGIQLRF